MTVKGWIAPRQASVVRVVAVTLVATIAVVGPASGAAQAATCTIYGTNGADTLTGTEGDDVICGGNGNDVLVGLGGNDTLVGGNGADRLDGGAGVDQLDGGNGSDILDGGPGDDTLKGGNDGDRLTGGPGKDVLLGGNGNESIFGGSGNDALDGGNGRDSCDGGTGSNTFAACESQVNDPAPDPDSGSGEPPIEQDADVDGLPDVLELRAGLQPGAADSDGDGLTDLREFEGVTDMAVADSDGNGVPDGQDDPDADGLSAADEVALGTRPGRSDSDGDGLSDGNEVSRGTSPTVADSDGDGVTDGDEVALALNPLAADSDQDGVADGGDPVDHDVVADLPGVTFVAHGAPTMVLDVRVTDPGDAGLVDVPGQRAPPVLVQAPAGVSGTLTIAFDTAGIAPDARLALVHFSDDSSTFDVPRNQHVDLVAGTATVTTDSFSPFVLVDLDEMESAWQVLMDVPRDRTPIDLALVVDLSIDRSVDGDAMVDRQRDAALAIIDALQPGDRVALGYYPGGAGTLEPLTSDLAAVRAQVEELYRAPEGSTYPIMQDVLSAAIELLAGTADPDRYRTVVAFSDGGGWSYPWQMGAYPGAGVPVNIVGFAPLFLEYQVQEIADWGGGVLVKVAADGSPASAVPALGLTPANAPAAADTDGDGLTNAVETGGWRDGKGRLHRTDPDDPDSDGDGLTDRDEAGQLHRDGPAGQRTYYALKSDPGIADTDGDGLNDQFEVASGLRAWQADADGDGLNDFAETQTWDTSPFVADSDSDGFDDYDEVVNMDLGADPLITDERLTALEYAGEFSRGALCGDITGWGGFCDSASIAFLAGSIAIGFIPVVFDIRDAIADAFQGEYGYSGLAMVAIVPYFGDGLSVVSKSTKFIKRIEEVGKDASPILKWALDQNLSESLQRKLLQESVGPAVTKLLDMGISDSALIRMARRGQRLETLARAVDAASAVTKSVPFSREQAAEDALRQLIGDTSKRVSWWAPDRSWGRIWDAFEASSRTAHEVKTGWVRASGRAGRQFERDLQALQSRMVESVVWDFYAGPTGTFGPDSALLERFLDAQAQGYAISFRLWVP